MKNHHKSFKINENNYLNNFPGVDYHYLNLPEMLIRREQARQAARCTPGLSFRIGKIQKKNLKIKIFNFCVQMVNKNIENQSKFWFYGVATIIKIS